MTRIGFIFFLFISFQVQAETLSYLNLFSDSFVSESFEATNQSHYQYLGVQLKSERFAKDQFKLNVSGAYAFGAPLLSYLNISEMYFETETNTNTHFYIGRKTSYWSFTDSQWGLGLWEPVFKWNPLEPEAQGLTGLFLNHRVNNIEFNFFASPLFIPDQGPSFDLQNGTFVKGNPWFRRPPESFRFSSEVSQIQYEFEKPKESQIVFQTNLGAQVAVDLNPHTVKSTYMYKPMNQLALGYDAVMDISLDKGIVNIEPQVAYHSLTAFEYVYNGRYFNFGFNVTYDRPKNDSISWKNSLTHPEFNNSDIYGSFVEVSINSKWNIGLRSLDIFGGEVKDIGEWSSMERTSITSRYPYKQATTIYTDYGWNLSKKRWVQTELSYTWSEKNQFDLLKSKFKFKADKDWYFSSQIVLVDAQEINIKNVNDITQFRNNDKISIGVSYVF